MLDNYQRIELITGEARHRHWTTQQKLAIIQESMVAGETVLAVSRRHGVAANLLYRWRRLMTQGGAMAVGSDEPAVNHKRIFAVALNLVACFTPVQSPESSGIAESFVKTFKRDYVRVQPLPDAITVLGQIARWFEDYNDNHTHSGLKMRSPREFVKAQVQ